MNKKAADTVLFTYDLLVFLLLLVLSRLRRYSYSRLNGGTANHIGAGREYEYEYRFAEYEYE